MHGSVIIKSRRILTKTLTVCCVEPRDPRG